VRAPLLALRDEYYDAMAWDRQSGMLRRDRAAALGIDELLDGYLS